MERKRNFTPDRVTVDYLNSILEFDSWTDTVFSLAQEDYGEESDHVQDFLDKADELKAEVFKLMNSHTELKLNSSENLNRGVVEF